MTTVTGHLLTTDTGGAGPSVGDVFAPGSTLDFDPDSYTAEYAGILNYPTTSGDVSGIFYYIGEAWYLVPMETCGSAPADEGTATAVNAAGYGTSASETITAPDESGWMIYGGADTSPTGIGDDTIHGGLGDDTVYAGDGNDTIYYVDGSNIDYGGDSRSSGSRAAATAGARAHIRTSRC